MSNLYDSIMSIISNAGSYGLIIDCALIIIESIIPPLPLGIFITVLFVNYGVLLGFIISWFFAVIGSIISFFLFQTIFKKIVDNYVRKNNKINKFIKLVDNIKMSNLALIIAIPFTPQFLVNISAGISKLEFKKFLPAVIIGKISLVLFWGLVGTSIIDSLRNPISLIKVFVMLFITYIITKIVNKKFNID